MILRQAEYLAGNAALLGRAESSDDHARALEEAVGMAYRGELPTLTHLRSWQALLTDGDGPVADLEAVLAAVESTLGDELRPLADGAPSLSVIPAAMREALGDELASCALRHPGDGEIARLAGDLMFPLLALTPHADVNERLARLLACYVLSYFGVLLPVFGPEDRAALAHGRTQPARLRLLVASKIRAAVRSRDGSHALVAAADGSDWLVAPNDPELRMLVDWGELRTAENGWERELSEAEPSPSP